MRSPTSTKASFRIDYLGKNRYGDGATEAEANGGKASNKLKLGTNERVNTMRSRGVTSEGVIEQKPVQGRLIESKNTYNHSGQMERWINGAETSHPDGAQASEAESGSRP